MSLWVKCQINEISGRQESKQAAITAPSTAHAHPINPCLLNEALAVLGLRVPFYFNRQLFSTICKQWYWGLVWRVLVNSTVAPKHI